MLHESRNNFLRKTVFQCFSTFNLLPVAANPLFGLPQGPHSHILVTVFWVAKKGLRNFLGMLKKVVILLGRKILKL